MYEGLYVSVKVLHGAVCEGSLLYQVTDHVVVQTVQWRESLREQSLQLHSFLLVCFSYGGYHILCLFYNIGPDIVYFTAVLWTI